MPQVYRFQVTTPDGQEAAILKGRRLLRTRGERPSSWRVAAITVLPYAYPDGQPYILRFEPA